MDKNEIGRMLKALTQADGASGREADAVAVARTLGADFVDEWRVDPLGNLIGLRRGAERPGGRIMLAAHIDEIGLVVTKVEDGFLHVGRLGAVDARTWVGQEVSVHPSGGGGSAPSALRGYIGERPPHLGTGRQTSEGGPQGGFRVDIGLRTEDAARLIRVGDTVTVVGPYLELLGGRVASKALDDRAGVAVMIGALGYLAGMRHDWDVVAVATTQEEGGLRGAVVAGFGVAPDAAIAIDVTFGDTPGLDDAKTVPMGKGPAIGTGPNLHPGIVKALRQAAEAAEIACVTEALPGASGTDAWAIQVAREGIPTGLVSLPVRYMHTATEVAVLDDIDRAARLLAGFIARLTAGSLDGLAEEV
jgi:endoglucanase